MKIGYFKVKPVLPVAKKTEDSLPVVVTNKLPTVRPEIKSPATSRLRVLALPVLGISLAIFLLGSLQLSANFIDWTKLAAFNPSVLDTSRYQVVTNINLPANVSFLSSIYDRISNWLSLLTNWFVDLWGNLLHRWRVFLGLERSVDLVSTLSQSLTPTTTSENFGLAVVPNIASTSREQLVKENLQKMFADPIDLKFDPVGSTGIITPVFRDEGQEGDYVFVLTPVK